LELLPIQNAFTVPYKLNFLDIKDIYYTRQMITKATDENMDLEHPDNNYYGTNWISKIT